MDSLSRRLFYVVASAAYPLAIDDACFGRTTLLDASQRWHVCWWWRGVGRSIHGFHRRCPVLLDFHDGWHGNVTPRAALMDL